MPRPVNTISLDYEQFSFMLFSSAQVLTLISSLVQVDCWYDDAGVVSKLDRALPVCILAGDQILWQEMTLDLWQSLKYRLRYQWNLT